MSKGNSNVKGDIRCDKEIRMGRDPLSYFFVNWKKCMVKEVKA